MISERYSFWSLLLNKSLMKNFIFSVVFLYEWSIFFSELVFQTLRWFQTIAENFKKNKQAWVGGREHNIKYNFCPNFDHNFFFFFFFFWGFGSTRFRCPKLKSCAISRKTNEPTFKKWQKKSNFRHNFGPFGPNLGSQRFFSGFTPTSS